MPDDTYANESTSGALEYPFPNQVYFGNDSSTETGGMIEEGTFFVCDSLVYAYFEEWTEDEICDFLDERNERQITFFEILSEKGEIERNDLLEEMKRLLKVQKFEGLQLAGSLAGIGIRTNRLGKEYLYIKEWRGEYRYYRLAEKYAAIIKKWLES